MTAPTFALRRRLRWCAPAAALTLLFACSDDDGGAPSEPGPGRGDEDGGRTGRTDAGGGGDAGDAGVDTSADVGPSDTGGGGDTNLPDTPGTDTGPDDCDRDQDGARSVLCGGDDCDDNDRNRRPGRPESCDAIDNDCDGRVNNGLTCTIFAHTANELYEIDPFKNTMVYITDVPSLLDFDTDNEGTLWGVTSSALKRFDADSRDWDTTASLGAFTGGLNGFAIDFSGERGFATAGNNVYSIELDNGEWELIGSMGGGFVSSGDCVTDKANRLFMTSDHHDHTDTLVEIDIGTGRATEIGDIGFAKIYGLTSAWGQLFGLSSSGELIHINQGTGEGTLLHTFSGRSWYGAASTPNR